MPNFSVPQPSKEEPQSPFTGDSGKLPFDGGYYAYGVSKEQMDAYIKAGLLTPVGNGMFRVEGATGLSKPAYLSASYDNNGFTLNAWKNKNGDRDLSASYGPMTAGVSGKNLKGKYLQYSDGPISANYLVDPSGNKGEVAFRPTPDSEFAVSRQGNKNYLTAKHGGKVWDGDLQADVSLGTDGQKRAGVTYKKQF